MRALSEKSVWAVVRPARPATRKLRQNGCNVRLGDDTPRTRQLAHRPVRANETQLRVDRLPEVIQIAFDKPTFLSFLIIYRFGCECGRSSLPASSSRQDQDLHCYARR